MSSPTSGDGPAETQVPVDRQGRSETLEGGRRVATECGKTCPEDCLIAIERATRRPIQQADHLLDQHGVAGAQRDPTDLARIRGGPARGPRHLRGAAPGVRERGGDVAPDHRPVHGPREGVAERLQVAPRDRVGDQLVGTGARVLPTIRAQDVPRGLDPVQEGPVAEDVLDVVERLVGDLPVTGEDRARHVARVVGGERRDSEPAAGRDPVQRPGERGPWIDRHRVGGDVEPGPQGRELLPVGTCVHDGPLEQRGALTVATEIHHRASLRDDRHHDDAVCAETLGQGQGPAAPLHRQLVLGCPEGAVAGRLPEARDSGCGGRLVAECLGIRQVRLDECHRFGNRARVVRPLTSDATRAELRGPVPDRVPRRHRLRQRRGAVLVDRTEQLDVPPS